jgi:hypothetical protein
MRPAFLPVLVVAAGPGLFALSGCASSQSTVEAAPASPSQTAAEPVPASDATLSDPTLAELPNPAARPRRSIAAKVGIQQYRRPPQVPMVPDFKEPPLTPEERAALGEDQPKPPDEFNTFAKNERGLEHGVGPFEARVTTATYGIGGAEVGLNPATSYYGSWGMGGFYAGIDFRSRPVAIGYESVTPRTGIGPESRVLSGEGTERSGAKRAEHDD